MHTRVILRSNYIHIHICIRCIHCVNRSRTARRFMKARGHITCMPRLHHSLQTDSYYSPVSNWWIFVRCSSRVRINICKFAVWIYICEFSKQRTFLSSILSLSQTFHYLFSHSLVKLIEALKNLQYIRPQRGSRVLSHAVIQN